MIDQALEEVEGTATKFAAYYEAALDKGADPLVLLLFVLILLGLLIVGLKIWSDYKIKVHRLRSGYSPEPGEERDSAKSAATPALTVPNLEITKELIKEMTSEVLSPLLSLLGESISATQRMAQAIEKRDADSQKVNRANELAHQQFKRDADTVKSSLNEGMTNMTSLFKTGYEAIVGNLIDSQIKAAIVILDKKKRLAAWNDEGRKMFTSSDDESKAFTAIGKPLQESHSKGLGSNEDLNVIIEKAHSANRHYLDILELSTPAAEAGKWNWYLMAVLPFEVSTILIFLDIGDISRGEMPTKDKLTPSKPKITKVKEVDAAPAKVDVNSSAPVAPLPPVPVKVKEEPKDGKATNGHEND